MSALDEAIASVTRSKREIATTFKSRGIRELADCDKPPFKDDDEVQRMKTSLLRKIQETSKYEQMKKQYKVALFDGREALDSLDRQLKLAEAGISDKELEDLAVTIKKIDERLNAADAGGPGELIKGDHDLDKILRGEN